MLIIDEMQTDEQHGQLLRECDREPSFLDDFERWFQWCLRKHGYQPAIKIWNDGFLLCMQAMSKRIEKRTEVEILLGVSKKPFAIIGSS